MSVVMQSTFGAHPAPAPQICCLSDLPTPSQGVRAVDIKHIPFSDNHCKIFLEGHFCGGISLALAWFHTRGSSCAGLAGSQATLWEINLFKLMYLNVFTFYCLFFFPYMKCSDFRNIQKLLQSSETLSQRVLTHVTAAPFPQILANSLIITMASLNM